MRSPLRRLGLLAALALVALPARAQDDQAPAAEATPSAAERAAKRAARKAELRAWHAKQKAIQEAKARAEAEARAAESVPEAAALPPAPQAAVHAESKLDGGALDSQALDSLPGAGIHQALGAHPEHAATTADEHGAAPAHGAAAAEHGEEGGGEHPGFSVGTFIFQLINFGLLLFILIYFGGRAMSKALRAKHEQLKAEIDEATRQRDEAKRKLDEQERRMAALEKEIATVREAMRKDAELEQARLLEAAQERGKKIQEEMRAQIDEQVKVAAAALRAEVANASVALAEEMVRKAVGFEDERRLAREFVAGFGDGTSGEAR